MKAWCCLVFERGQVPLGISFSQEISELTYVCGLCGPKRRLPVRVLLPFSLNPSSFSGPKGLEPPGYKPSLGSEADQTGLFQGGLGGWEGTMGSWRPLSVLYALCLLAAVHSLHAVAFSHVSFVRHVSLQLLSVMSDMSIMSACVSAFPVFSFHLSKYFTLQFSATKCRVNLHDNFVTCFAEGFHVKRFSLLTLLLKGDISERHKKSLFSFLINNLVAVEAS